MEYIISQWYKGKPYTIIESNVLKVSLYIDI